MSLIIHQTLPNQRKAVKTDSYFKFDDIETLSIPDFLQFKFQNIQRIFFKTFRSNLQIRFYNMNNLKVFMRIKSQDIIFGNLTKTTFVQWKEISKLQNQRLNRKVWWMERKQTQYVKHQILNIWSSCQEPFVQPPIVHVITS